MAKVRDCVGKAMVSKVLLHPTHILNYRTNRDHILRLIDIHAQIAGAGVGYKANVEVLNKSAVVLLVACWEAFVEDLATAAFDFMIAYAPSPNSFPPRVLALSTESLRTADDGREVWKLAGEGWRQVLKNHQQAINAQFVGKLNPPRPRQVDEIFDRMLGLKGLSSKWNWKGMPNHKAIARLDRLVTLRGEIAHRVGTSRGVHKEFVVQHAEFISRICAISSNRVREHIQMHFHKTPWVTYTVGKTY